MSTPVLNCSLLLPCIVLVVIIISYIKAPPSVAYIVSGLNRKPRIYIGKGGLRAFLSSNVSIRFSSDRLQPISERAAASQPTILSMSTLML